MKISNIFIALLLAAASVSPALALSTHIDPEGVYRFPYGDIHPPTLDCSPDLVCELILEQGEVVEEKVAGDTVRWIIAQGVAGPKADIPTIFFKPTDVSLPKDPISTNLIVTTNRRTYEVTLHAVKAPRYNRYGFYYPQEELSPLTGNDSTSPSIGMTTSAQVAQEARAYAASNALPGGSDAVPPQMDDFGYKIDGDTDYRPVVVWNDGVHTYVKMPPNYPAPSIYTALPDGKLQMVNYHPPINNVYTLDGMPEHIILIGSVGKHIPRIDILKGH